MKKTKSILLTLTLATISFMYAADRREALTVHQAAQDNDVAALRAFVEQDPDILLTQEQFGQNTPLICAIKTPKTTNQDYEAVRYILQFEAGRKTVHAKSSRGKSPLVYACDRNHLGIVTALLHSNANPNEVMPDGKPILAFAIKSPALANQLVLHGAQIMSEDEDDLMRLHSHGADKYTQSAMLRAYKTRIRLKERVLQHHLRCAGEMLQQERERNLLTLVNVHELGKANSALQEQLNESRESLERTQEDLAAAELKSDDEDSSSDELVALRLTIAHSRNREAMLEKENKVLLEQLDERRKHLEKLQEQLLDAAEGWDFPDLSPHE